MACALFMGNSSAATGVGVAGATVLPSNLSAAVALYVRAAAGASCTGGCAAGSPVPARWPPLAPSAPLVSMEGGVAQFTMFGETASNYVVRLNAAAYGAWPGRIDAPIMLEPTLTPGGRLSIVITLAPASTSADAFQVVVNYN